MLHFVQHDNLEVIRHAEFWAKSCVTVSRRRRRRAETVLGRRKRDRYTVLRAFLCVTVPETRPKRQKAGPTRRVLGKKLRDGIQTQEAEVRDRGGEQRWGQRTEMGRRFKQEGEEFRYH